jgi:hypothetical protein
MKERHGGFVGLMVEGAKVEIGLQHPEGVFDFPYGVANEPSRLFVQVKRCVQKIDASLGLGLSIGLLAKRQGGGRSVAIVRYGYRKQFEKSISTG